MSDQEHITAPPGLADVDVNTTTKAPEQVHLVQIETIPQFAGFIGNWHAAKMAMLQHWLTIPDGAAITVSDTEGGSEKEIILTGDVLLAFQAGILTGLNEFEQLPFAPLQAPPGEAANGG